MDTPDGFEIPTLDPGMTPAEMVGLPVVLHGLCAGVVGAARPGPAATVELEIIPDPLGDFATVEELTIVMDSGDG